MRRNKAGWPSMNMSVSPEVADAITEIGVGLSEADGRPQRASDHATALRIRRR